MMFLKACPKCHGDVCVDRDQYGSFAQCLQCGLLRDIPQGQVLRGHNAQDRISKLLGTQPYPAKALA
jgi:hypothetical protein